MHLTDICSLLDVNFHRKKTLLWKFWQNRSTFLPIKWKIENSLSWIWIHSENRSNQQCSVSKQWSLKTGLKPIIEMRKNTNFFVTWFIILSACFIVSFFFRFFFFTGMPSECMTLALEGLGGCELYWKWFFFMMELRRSRCNFNTRMLFAGLHGTIQWNWFTSADFLKHWVIHIHCPDA